MRIQFENVDFQSRSGPNGFGLKLAREMTKIGHSIVSDSPDVRLTFINGSNTFRPNVLRLDGIYFNSEQDWQRMNYPIMESYKFANAVIVQSEFNRNLTEKYFGKRDQIHVIHNGTDTDLIEKIPPAVLGGGIPRENLWMCASAWRPHKRLSDNIRLFLELSNRDDILLVAGKDTAQYAGQVDDSRVKFLGDLNWESMISCMKASSKFIHLSWLDHCPNVVVDANACGCTVFCSSSGGTKEIAGKNAVIIEEDEEWNMMPTKLYRPPSLDITRMIHNNTSCSLDIRDTAQQYLNILEHSLRNKL